MSGGEATRFASVAVAIPGKRLFTYAVPERLYSKMARGARVRVSFARRRRIATVVEWPAPRPPDTIEVHAVEEILEDAPAPDAALLDLTKFVSDYYLCSWGEAIESALPADPGRKVGLKNARRAPGADATTIPARAIAQRRAFEALPADGRALALANLDPATRRALAVLAGAGLAVIEAQVAARATVPAEARAGEPGPLPTPPQRAVLALIREAVGAGTWAPFLLFGATGSGKTEVYLSAAETVLARGRGVLYLVPEIGLTPLLAARVERRFPGQVAVLHSGLTTRERWEAWQRVKHDEQRFVLGARSAIFAPLRSPGLIVVDEEQDSSYKQQETPRYNARDLAVLRARENQSVLILGSATPSLETFHHAKSGRYTLLPLGGRVEDRPLPTVKIVDMRAEFQLTGKQRPLSRALAEALKLCVARGEQALVLRNRRGWAPAVACLKCGARVQCPRCSVTLTWHERSRRLRCHYCLFETGWPSLCGECGSIDLKILGEGSERIEHELRQALPPATRIARMDRDTMRRRGAAAALLGQFDRGEIDVLVGTQMIAKGHDFPNVTLVGVLSADQSLGLPDFRAAERTFQLLTQVAGRAGRGKVLGTVVVQAFDPGHPVLAEAASHDFDAFYAREIRYRRALRYPPLTALVQILITDRDPARAAAWAQALAEALRTAGEGRLLISGPGKAPLERLKGLWRQQILARTAGRRRLVAAVASALAAVEGVVPVRAIHVDVDPVSLL